MYSVLVILVVLASILMCLIVLVQESKGGGLASGFADNNAMLGVRKTTDVVEKITWGLAIAMVVFSVISVGFLSFGTTQGTVMQTTTEETALPGMETGSSSAEQPVATPQTEGIPAN
ncbi:MAG: preprotein translocase subunit SecG [Prevotellaceae bacterium]|nr:preprotein translocase subunit SecG [Prevotellaceae bacterium]MCD8285349.1 preprotein translocase subunit SecG [Prevotellaceae bacterium]MCD8304739.1 preprotein translocase subunit SecG [Prevotellaceae bacterium]